MATLRAGVDLGGTKIQTVVVDADHAVVGQFREPTPQDRGSGGVLDAVVDAVQRALESAGAGPDDLAGIGVGAPGQIDRAAGTVSHAMNLPEWTGTIDVAQPLGRALGAPVALANDVQVGVIAEARLGAGRPYRSVLGIFWGTGVGGGIVIDGTLWTGRGAAGEIGHMVVEADGRQCPCGRRGCMEAYAGRAAMETRVRKLHDDGHKTDLFKIMEHKGRSRLSSGVWAKALDQGDPMAVEAIDKAIWAIGIAGASAINLIDVESVVIGGGLGCRLGEPYVARIREAMSPHLVLPERPPAVVPAALGDLGGAIGATLLFETAATG
jgi:glucokinase